MNPPANPFVITQREWQKYQEQFGGLQPLSGYVTGAQAKNFFLQSQLPPTVLGQIWSLADTDSDGKLDLNEFSIACKLINLKLRGVELPKRLPASILESLRALGSPTAAAVAAPIVAPAAAAPPIAANLPGAVPAIPGIVPGTLPGIVPHAVVPSMPANVMTTAIPTALPSSNAGGVAMQQQMPGIIPTVMPGVIPPVMPGMVPTTIPGVMPQAIIPPTGMVPVGALPTAIMPPVANVNTAAPAIPGVGLTKIISPPGEVKIPAIPTPPHSNPPSRHMSISERAPSIESPNQSDWIVKAAEKRKYTQVFNTNDRMRTGYLTGNQARAILVQSKLPQKTLAEIWTLSDIDQDGRLSCDEFILAMFLCDKAIKKEPLPTALPPDWIPPSYRNVIKSRHGSLSAAGSRIGSTTSSRHASISSQGAMDADPTAGLPQTSFEDKRKENFDKGQAELDRRRKLLQDQQRKEKEERERKEREEAEKREKARLEAERKQQEELERQLQKQRELELEREEQRKRELEAKEAARKELEKQRQLEWEKARIAEINSEKEREQERVLKLKAHNTQLHIELSTINEKIKELSQKICDTRASVTNVKSVIDGMRSQRDTCMSEMSQNKARIKEQNAKLMQLSQERAQVEAKVKATDASNTANKQLIIAQLKDKVENSKKEMEQKKEDINSNNSQNDEAKSELSAILKECEKLYLDYDSQRTQVLELKYNKKNDNVSAAAAAAAAWDTTATSAWGKAESTDQYAVSNETTAASLPPVSSVDLSGPAPEGFVKYRAVYEFTARNSDEITFVPGDIILVPLEQNAEPGWLAGEINGHTGWFPETYVEKIEDEFTAEVPIAATAVAVATSVPTAAAAAAAQDVYNDNSQTLATEAESATAQNGDIEYYIAAYPYESAEVGDLNFNAGEMVMVIKKEGEWWTGTIGNRTGMFPSNYVQKADVGNVITAETGEPPFDQQTANNVNGNAQTTTTTAYVDALKQDIQSPSLPNNVASTIHTTSDDSRTNEELDTEVSQINTQPKSQTEPAESYSRPMSRTSTMTPGMRAKRSEIAQVIAPYEATSSEQLSLTRGQLIMIRKKTDTGWWEGELQAKGRRRQIGWFPATYVKVLQGGRNSGRNTPVSGSRIEMTEQILDKVIALYPYKAQNDDELSFDKDDIISVLGRDEPEWWRGELNGLTGLFPSNYVGPFVTSGNI